MQDFGDNDKKQLKMTANWPFLDFISAKFVMGYPCVSPYILFYMHVQLFCFVFELHKYHKINQIQNGR